MLKMVRFTLRRWKDDEGATAIEYAFLGALIAMAIIAAVTTVGGTLADSFTNLNAELIANTN